MEDEFIVLIEKEIIKKFEIALELTNENANEILTEYIKRYIIKTFKKEASSMVNEERVNEVINYESSDKNYGKAINRLPRWASRPRQINSRIMRAFFELEEEGRAKKSKMEDLCNDQTGDIYVRDFSNNFNSMCTDAGNSHGKVFEVDNEGYVRLWDQIKDVAMAYKEEFLKGK